MADREVQAFNESGLDDAGETECAQLSPDVAERATQGTRESGDETARTKDFDDLSQMEVRAHLPGTVDPGAKMGSEQGVVLAQTVGEKDGDVSKGETVTETVNEGHGIRGFAGSQQVAENEFSFGVNSEPEPAHARGGAQLGTDFVELQDVGLEVAEEGIVEMVSLCPKTVKPTGDGVIVQVEYPRDVGARQPDGQEDEGGLHQQQRLVQAKERGMAAAGKDVLAGLAAEAANAALLSVPSVGDEGMDGGIGTAKVETGRIEAGMTVRGTAFCPSAIRFTGSVGWRSRSRKRWGGECSTQWAGVGCFRLGQLTFKPTPPNLSEVVVQCFARCLRCEKRAEC